MVKTKYILIIVKWFLVLVTQCLLSDLQEKIDSNNWTKNNHKLF